MVATQPHPRFAGVWARALVVSASLLGGGVVGGAEEPRAEPAPGETLPVVTLDEALNWAMRQNPEIAALRQQHGIAAAAVVIANTYPFNPLAENRIQVNSGPESAGVTNDVLVEQLTLLQVEVRGERTHRRAGAAAALSRTDWQIAYQEHLLAIRVIRAFRTLLYQEEKLRLAEETVQLDAQLVEGVRRLLEAGRARVPDLHVALTEVEDARARLDTQRSALTTARYELRRALGVVEERFLIQGTLDPESRYWDSGVLMQVGLALRPDRRARQAAVDEANARLRLTIAGRFGVPTFGSAFTYDPTRVSSGGVQFHVPLPVFNTRRGEIQQGQAEVARASLELRQTEVQIQQDVQAALARLEIARQRVDTYRTRLLPNLRASLDAMRRLFEAGEVDVLRVIDVQRKLLQARNSYLDALWELSQAQADVAAAVGEAALAVHPDQVSPGGP